MISLQRLPATLTSLDAASAALLEGLAPVTPIVRSLAEALGCVAAEMPPLRAVPSRDTAIADGWALHSSELVGASSYSPLPLRKPLVWVEAGAAVPAGCDCVIDADSIDQRGLIAEALREALPGEGVRRAGGDLAEGNLGVAPGRRIRPLDLVSLRTAAVEQIAIQPIKVRRPRLRLVNIPDRLGRDTTALMIADLARAEGAEVTYAEAGERDAASIAVAIEQEMACDILLVVGGSGVGRTDDTIGALARLGRVIAHGIALRPGRTAAVGRVANIPVVVLPGAPDQALAAWWTLVLPVLDRLSGIVPRSKRTLPLARKIASSVGLAEIALLQRHDDAWLPLAVGELSIGAIALADAWLLISAGAEGFAAGTPVDAYMLRE